MKLLVGLGNPGKKYEKNRHNVGHMFVDYMTSRKFIKSVKSSVFMNSSGPEVQKLVSRFTIHVSQDLYIAHDDLDIPLGKFKIQRGEGPKLHNGIESIEKAIGRDFWRIRIGVDTRTIDHWVDGERYVLSNFTVGEQDLLTTVFPIIYDRLLLLWKRSDSSQNS